MPEPLARERPTTTAPDCRSAPALASRRAGTPPSLAALCVAVVTGAWQRITHARRGFGVGEEADLFLHGPARFAGRAGMTRRATLEAHLRVKALLADRAAMARGDRSLLELIAPGETSEEQWPAIVLDRMRAGPQIVGRLANPDWRRVFADRSGTVFPSRVLADRLGLPAASPAPLLRGPRAQR